MGQEKMQPFFSGSETQDALDRVASADSLTLFVGAGSSTEVGFPTWPELVERLCRDVAMAQGLTTEADIEGFVNSTIRSEGLLGAGSIARASLAEAFEERVVGHLYAAVPQDPQPGPTALGVARLAASLGGRCDIVTTNYDLLLEDALTKVGYQRSNVKSYVVNRRSKTGNVAVRHLHGLRTPSREAGKLVLSESDYHLMQSPGRWQEEYFRDRLKKTICLFTGTSLSDPNLLRYLYRSADEPRHVAVLVRQSDASDGVAITGLRSVREETARRRWLAMGIVPLQADFFVQSAQFLYEAWLMRTKGDDYKRYGERLMAWDSEMEGGLRQVSDLARYRSVQDDLQEELAIWAADAKSRLISSGSAATALDEATVGLHLWLRVPRKRAIVHWASSDHSWRDPTTLVPLSVHQARAWAPIQAFQRGTWVVEDLEGVPTTRWNAVVGIPVIIDNEVWGRMPVGALSLASTLGPSESGFRSSDPAPMAEVVRFLEGNAAKLLTP